MTTNYCPRCRRPMGDTQQTEHGVCPLPASWEPHNPAMESAEFYRDRMRNDHPESRYLDAYPWEPDTRSVRPIDWARYQRHRTLRPAIERMTVVRDDYGPALTPAGVTRAVWRGRLVAVWNAVRSDTGWYLAWAMLAGIVAWLVLTAWTVWRLGH